MVKKSPEKTADGPTPKRERRFSRQSSRGSQGSALNFAGLQDGDVAVPLQRQRTPSGKSIRSRTASRAEYHDDLKIELEQKININLIFAAGVIMTGCSFPFGYNIGVLNQPSALIKDFYNETYTERNGGITSNQLTFLWSLTTALYVPGGCIGAYSAGFLADRIGRKKAVLFSQIFSFIGAALSTVCKAASAPELLMIGRFFTGINCGFGTQLAPMYLAEITPFNLRGAFGTGHQLFITIGIFIGSMFGLREILGTELGWPYVLLINIGPAIICLILLPFVPDSPRYLMLIKNERKSAEKGLKFFRKRFDVIADIEEMETELSDKELATGEEESYTMKQLLQNKALRWPLAIAVMLQVIQQLSGINAIFFYSSSIFEGAGVSKANIQYAVLGTNFVNVFMTVIALPLMDRLGRRPLLLYPMIVMNFILALITIALNLKGSAPWLSYVSIFCVISYVVCFAVGLGPIPPMVGAELFRQGPRPRAMSCAGFANWFFTVVVAISFELVQKAIKEYTFLIFLGLMILFTVFVYFKVPETKNKTFEEIASLFQPGGDIEVEEFVEEDVFKDTGADGDGPHEASKLMNERERNGSVASKEDVKIKMKDDKQKDELKSLTKSEENINNPQA